MKTSLIIATGLIAMGTELAAYAGQARANAKFCQAAVAYQNDIAELQAIGPHSTIGELRAARRRVDKDVDRMRDEASWMKTASSKRFSDAMNRLYSDVNSIPNDATLGQVQSQVESDAKTALDAGRQVAAESGCPVAPQK